MTHQLLESPFFLLDTFSASMLLAVLAWTIYHIPILLAGLTAEEEPPPPASRNLPRLSVIIPVKDEGGRLRRLLEALLAADYPPEKLEIIVIDGSWDGAGEAIAREFAASSPAPIKVLREPNPRGKPTALNTALAYTTGDVVAVFDADSVPERDALLRAVSRFSDPNVAAVQGSAVALNSSESMVARVASKEERVWFQAILRGRKRLNLFTPLTGSCQFVRADVLRALGGWPDRLAEDLELSLELFKRGYRVEYAPDVVSKQEAPRTLKSLVTQRRRWYRGYMEAALRYSAGLLRMGGKGLDAVILSSGPYFMVLCFLALASWFLSLLAPHQNSFPAFLEVVVALNIASLFSVSLALSLSEKPYSIRNLAWVPFIYLYWFTLTAVAFLSLLEVATARPRVWRRTPK